MSHSLSLINLSRSCRSSRFQFHLTVDRAYTSKSFLSSNTDGDQFFPRKTCNASGSRFLYFNSRASWIGHQERMIELTQQSTNLRSFSSGTSFDKIKGKDRGNEILNSGTTGKDLILEKSYATKAKDLLNAGVQLLINFIVKTPGVLWYFLTHPKELREKLISFKELAKKEVNHYYMGSKLLIADIRTAKTILNRTLNGSHLSRRERKQLVRTVSDVFRLVPMSVFVLVPFMEFLLPFALKIFPNMLPSTFQDSLKAEENMKRELQSRIVMAGFLQETLQSLVKKKKGGETSSTEKNDSAADFLQFLESARKGERLPPEAIIKFSSYFKDEFTLENFPRAQLVNICRYMNIPPYGADTLLRFQLRHKIRSLKEDDQRIIFEGIDTLTKMELREACQERGMRSTGLSKDGYREQLGQWLELSVVKDVPIALLVISRTYMLKDEHIRSKNKEEPKEAAIANLADAMSGLDKDVLNEIVLEVATDEENRSNPDVMKIKLEVVKQQNELIAVENEAKVKSKVDSEEKEKKAKAEESPEDTSLKSNEGINEDLATEISHGDVSSVSSEEKMKKDTEIFDASSTDDISDMTDSDEKVNESKEDDDDAELSPEELDAIKQLISPDSLTNERAELQKIKKAMQNEEETNEEKSISDEVRDNENQETDNGDGLSPEDINSTSRIENDVEKIDQVAENQIKQSEDQLEVEAASTTKFYSDVGSADGKDIEMQTENEIDTGKGTEEEESKASDKKLEKTVSTLKDKLESMVAKIEKEMEVTSLKIGDRMHLLDLDQDGILSKEEVAVCLQTVLKRKLTLEEAMALASDMDTDEDGYFTVAEFNRWVDSNKLVKLVEEGREDEVDEAIQDSMRSLDETEKK